MHNAMQLYRGNQIWTL